MREVGERTEAAEKDSETPHSPEARLAANAARVDRILASLCRRNAWLGNEADDFCQWVRLRLHEDDHALVRAFTGRASFATFLTVVIQNLLRDFRNQQLGKWRPSAAAQRLGEAGVLLDTLLHRDRRSLDVAIEMLRRNHGVRLSPAVLASMAATLPPHFPRRIEGDHDLGQRPASDRADARVLDGEQARVAQHAETALAQALEALEPEDKLLLKLRYQEGFRVSQIARRLQREPKALYRTFDKLLVVLRRRLEAAGLTATAVIGILGRDARDSGPSQPRSSETRGDP